MPDSDLLAELKRLHETMTPGEWYAATLYPPASGPSPHALLIGPPRVQIDRGSAFLPGDGEGIAALRNALPKIIAALTPGGAVVAVHTASESGHDRPPGSQRG